MTVSTSFVLQPLVSNSQSDIVNEDDWLLQNDVSSLDASEKNSKADEGSSKANVYHCDKLLLTVKDSSVWIDSAEGDAELFSGDIIHIAKQVYFIQVEHTADELTPSKVNRSPVADIVSGDIWAGDDSYSTHNELPEPFKRGMGNIAEPNASQQRVHPSDNSVSFLYPSHFSQSDDPNALLATSNSIASSENYFSGDNNVKLPGAEGNVIHELGIDDRGLQQHLGNNSEANKSVMDESPMDRLDEYLKDDRVVSSLPQERLNTATPINNEQQNTGWLSGIKYKFSGKHQ